MADEPEENSQALAVSDNSTDTEKRARRTYSEAEKITALLDLDANSGNVHRTALALDIPYATLAGWEADRRSGKLQSEFFRHRIGEKEKRGDLAVKMESVLHSLVESMAGKIGKATLSQTAVAVGILTDKIRILRGQGLDPDPATELCRLLNINRAQLPPTLQLEPGEEIPEGFGPVIETTQTEPNSFEPQTNRDERGDLHAPDCPKHPCSCGVSDLREQQDLISEPDDDKPAN